MSSPTINLPQGSQDTSLETIANLVRALINDSQAGLTSTPGEGQIFTDNPAVSPFVQPLLMSSIRELYRELRNVGDPTLIKDNVIILGLPPVNSPINGVAGADPAVQTVLSLGGYFDGVKQWQNYLLPSDMLYPERLWERQTGSNDSFQPMTQSKFGLAPRPQVQWLSEWEWRNNNLNFNGALEMRDIRMRYYASLPTFFSQTLNFSTTYVPILDCTDAVAYKTAVKYARMLGSPGLADLAVESKEQMFQLKNANTRRAQSVNYMRIPYGHSDGDYANGYYTAGWQ
jgi:hypothetical protein